MSTGAGKVVCVTGASGYTASWLVKLLLDRGYNVKATVRSLRDPRKVEHLMAFEGAQERLQLFEANLTEEGSFDSAIDGCEGVFHTATPVFLSVADPQAELIEPAVKGTLNVLRSCRKVPLIKRVVVTSSIATVIYNRNPLNPDVVVDETWFSDPVFCEETKQWYAISKILAEEAARKFADENDIDLVTLHPGFVIGPLLQPTLNLTSEAVVNLIKEGREDWPNRYVDVRDVAHAHILAFENSSASGRYCLVESVTHSSEAPKVLNRLYPSLYPSLSLSANTTDNHAATPPYQISKERAKSLGVNFTPLEVSLKDTVENLKENKFLSF
ncbi:cinnamoyl- reductase 1-like [Olea europaea subsp. europaea]|uniref:Dihydroflavonol 4-reductase n=1 Tax=Olea europaea subsp. europaea TaxID=158383 RepID=A0A8S0QI44_OLEEU|nr:cinnamoyl- reductase 1-like [Olea europaea subsp. europaea]